MFTSYNSGGSFHAIFAVTDAETRVDPLTKRLRSLGQLPIGWSHGEGVPVTQQVIRVAEVFIAEAIQLQVRADVFPGLNGECAIAFYGGDRCVEVVVDPANLDATVGLHVEQGQGFDFVRTVSDEHAAISEAFSQILALLDDSWKSHASSPSYSLTAAEAGFECCLQAHLRRRRSFT